MRNLSKETPRRINELIWNESRGKSLKESREKYLKKAIEEYWEKSLGASPKYAGRKFLMESVEEFLTGTQEKKKSQGKFSAEKSIRRPQKQLLEKSLNVSEEFVNNLKE